MRRVSVARRGSIHCRHRWPRSPPPSARGAAGSRPCCASPRPRSTSTSPPATASRRAVERDDLDWVPPRTRLSSHRPHDAAAASEHQHRPVEETLAWEAEQRPRVATIAIVGGLLTRRRQRPASRSISSGGPTEDDGFISLTEALERAPRGPASPRDRACSSARSTTRRQRAAAHARHACSSSLAAVCARADRALPLPRHGRAQRPGRPAAVLRGRRRARALPARPPASARSRSGRRRGLRRRRRSAPPAPRATLARSAAVGAGSLLEFVGTFALAVGFVLVGAQRDARRPAHPVLRRPRHHRRRPGQRRAGGLPARPARHRPRVLADRRRPRDRRPPATTPPAWETGRAEPWPTQQQLREQRERPPTAPTPRPPTEAEGDAPPQARARAQEAQAPPLTRVTNRTIG